MLAVLKDALLNFLKNLHKPNKLFKADRAWFFQNDRDDLDPFEFVCAVLGLSAHEIRRRLQVWRSKPKASAASVPIEYSRKDRAALPDLAGGHGGFR